MVDRSEKVFRHTRLGVEDSNCKFIASQTALGRAGLPDDVGPAIASLLSDDNRWVNAQRIEVSGGQWI
jgi:NAD(P)-dependent dehydrogenase (short-subunit alcohol dehydrogenase family)